VRKTAILFRADGARKLLTPRRLWPCTERRVGEKATDDVLICQSFSFRSLCQT
jgi:hypothetical protein